MSTEGDAEKGWDYRLEEEAARVVALVREGGLQYRDDSLAWGPVPLFACQGRGDEIAAVSLRELLRVWEADPEKGEGDWEFIRELRRTDLPAGSFFVLVYPEKAERYHWALCLPEE
jgi:hypothetical protein